MGPHLGWSPHRSGTVSPVLEAAAGIGHPGVEVEDINSDHAWLLGTGSVARGGWECRISERPSDLSRTT